MDRFLVSLKRLLTRLAWSQKGVAAVEFALIVPVLLLAYLGATDITQGLSIDRKLGQFASTVSDMIAREEEADQAEVQAVIRTGATIMRPFDFDRTRLRVTVVEVDGSTARVTAATAHNWTTEANVGDRYDLPEEMLTLARNRHVIIATAAYEFRPAFGAVFNGTMNLQQRSIHLARQDSGKFTFDPDAGTPIPEEEGEHEGGGETEPPGEDEDGSSGGTGGEDSAGGDAPDRGNFWCRIFPRLCR